MRRNLKTMVEEADEVTRDKAVATRRQRKIRQEVLRRLYAECGVSQSELARRAGVTRQAVSRMATGATPVSHRVWLTICAAVEGVRGG